MSDAVALRTASVRHVANLRRIPQRVAQLAHFDTTANLLEADFRAYDQEIGDQVIHLETVQRCHNEQMHSVARLAFSPDLTVVASDGTRLPACRATFMAASPELKAMLSSGTAEENENEIRPEATAEALRHVLMLMHFPSLDAPRQPPFAVLLEASSLATQWRLDYVMTSLVTTMTSKQGAVLRSLEDWIAALSAATLQIEADESNHWWQEMAEAAAKALAVATPGALASTPGLKELGERSICKLINCLEPSQLELPSLDLLADLRKVSGTQTAQVVSDPFSVTGLAFSVKLRAYWRKASHLSPSVRFLFFSLSVGIFLRIIVQLTHPISPDTITP